MGLSATRNHAMRYNLVVIGNSIAGDDAAIAAATLSQRVAVINQPCRLKGNATHCRAVSSKTIRAAIRQMTRVGERDVFNGCDRQARRLTMLELRRQAGRLVDDER